MRCGIFWDVNSSEIYCHFHHKTGSLDCVEHDAGIIETMNGDFCFVLLMSHLDNDKAKQLGAQMGLIMKEFVEDALP